MAATEAAIDKLARPDLLDVARLSFVARSLPGGKDAASGTRSEAGAIDRCSASIIRLLVFLNTIINDP